MGGEVLKSEVPLHVQPARPVAILLVMLAAAILPQCFDRYFQYPSGPRVSSGSRSFISRARGWAEGGGRQRVRFRFRVVINGIRRPTQAFFSLKNSFPTFLFFGPCTWSAPAPEPSAPVGRGGLCRLFSCTSPASRAPSMSDELFSEAERRFPHGIEATPVCVFYNTYKTCLV